MSFCPPSLLDFGQVVAKPALGEKFLPLPHIIQVANALNRVITGTLPGGKRNLIINIPPRHGKTLFSCEIFPAFGLGINPGSKFILTGSTIDRSRRSSVRVKKIIRCPEYRRIFPWTAIDDSDTDAKEEWYTTAGGGLYAVGATGSIIGFGAGSDLPGFWGAIIVDDPLKYLEARSETVRKSVIDNLTGGIMTRVNGANTPIILIMQRLHPEDPCGWLLKNFPDDWHLLSLKCVQDDGSHLWPGKLSPEYLERLRIIDPFTYYNQYQQSARMPGGNMILEKWWGTWTQDDLNQCRGLFMTADTAYKKTKGADNSAISVWAYSPDAILLIDQVSGKWEWPDLVKQAKRLRDQYRPVRANELHLGPIVIEDKASGTSLEQHLRSEGFSVVPWSGKGKDKVFWAKQMLPGIYGKDGISGKSILLPESAPWKEEFLEEAGEFTEDMSHSHDDRLNTVWIADDVWRSSGGIIR